MKEDIGVGDQLFSADWEDRLAAARVARARAMDGKPPAPPLRARPSAEAADEAAPTRTPPGALNIAPLGCPGVGRAGPALATAAPPSAPAAAAIDRQAARQAAARNVDEARLAKLRSALRADAPVAAPTEPARPPAVADPAGAASTTEPSRPDPAAIEPTADAQDAPFDPLAGAAPAPALGPAPPRYGDAEPRPARAPVRRPALRRDMVGFALACLVGLSVGIAATAWIFGGGDTAPAEANAVRALPVTEGTAEAPRPGDPPASTGVFPRLATAPRDAAGFPVPRHADPFEFAEGGPEAARGLSPDLFLAAMSDSGSPAQLALLHPLADVTTPLPIKAASPPPLRPTPEQIRAAQAARAQAQASYRRAQEPSLERAVRAALRFLRTGG
ncbi:hypothetical protein V8J36_08985 [Frigidibacter sp. MR17.14]|uniref:hypothetical protein n=1 Tax=Frigidibacter sp. MR17.14 TaxID=3126509 RepID=UPI003012F478